MVLRLVYSFLFFTLVTGNERGQAYSTHGMVEASPVPSISPLSHIEAKSFNVEFVSDEVPILEVPRPIQYIEEDSEKTICITPTMVDKMIKAVLEYVSQIPSDTNKIIEKLDQEFNRMPVHETIDENSLRTPLYPLDSKKIIQMLDKSRSEAKSNLILKYEVPSTQKSQCREVLEKLIEIALYTAYKELEAHPQCRNNLYNFAVLQSEDHSTGHFDRGLDLSALITSLLDQISKHTPNVDISLDRERYIIMPMSLSEGSHPLGSHPSRLQPSGSHPLEPHPMGPQPLEYTPAPVHSIPEIHEYNMPQSQEYINENNFPQVPQFVKPELILSNGHEYSKTPNYEYNVPQVIDLTQSQEYNGPKVPEFSITREVPDYLKIQTGEYSLPEIENIIIPQVQTIEMPKIYETTHETIEEVIPKRPEDTIDTLLKLVQRSNENDHGNLPDRLINILEENQNNFNPRIFKHLLTLLSAHKQNKVPQFNDIFLMLLDSQRNRDWPWDERVTEHLMSHLIPDHTGNLDSRMVKIILNLYKQRPKENHIEYILSLLKQFKEGNLDPTIGDIILKLVHLYQSNLLLPDYVDIILNFLKPNQNDPIEVDIVNNLSRWNEMGIKPNQLNGLFALLKSYVINGHANRRPIDIIHFLLTKSRQLDPKHLDFILSFLYPENGILDTKRIDIIYFILTIESRYPKHANILLNLLQENAPFVLNSKFLEILLLLNNNRLLNSELIETIIYLLTNEVTGQLDDNKVKTMFLQLGPLKQSNPNLILDILGLVNQGGLYGNLVKWFETVNSTGYRPHHTGLSNWDSKQPNIKVAIEESIINQDEINEYGTADDQHQTVGDGQQNGDYDFMSIFKWLYSQGLFLDQGSNTDLVKKNLNMVVGQPELGVVELTYKLKHEKPLLYQPVYYVKYSLPISSFKSNMKSLLLERPNLNSDPMKLLNELIVVSNVTEVSPNLQGYPKEEILKLTFNDGDLVQAKILDEQNFSLNEQINYVHDMNPDISPEELLQLNRINEATYFPNLLEVKGVHPDQVTVKEVDKIISVPLIRHGHNEMNPELTDQTKTTHHSYIAQTNQNQEPLYNSNAQ